VSTVYTGDMSETDNLHIRMKPEDLAELRLFAAEDGLPASALARTYIKAGMRSRPQPAGVPAQPKEKP